MEMTAASEPGRGAAGRAARTVEVSPADLRRFAVIARQQAATAGDEARAALIAIAQEYEGEAAEHEPAFRFIAPAEQI